MEVIIPPDDTAMHVLHILKMPSPCILITRRMHLLVWKIWVLCDF